jgi:hypothetical protein
MISGSAIVRASIARFIPGVTGRLGMLAGFSSPIVLLALEMLHGSPVSHSVNYTFAFLAGSVATIALVAPRISIISPAMSQIPRFAGDDSLVRQGTREL